MRTWETLLSLETSGDQPLFERIAAVITEDIARGRLEPGEKLPSTRALAAQLGVNRKTVVAAFDRLRHEGRVEVESTGGTRVARTPPRARPRDAPSQDAPGFDLPPPLPARRTVPRHPGMRLLLGGVPDLRLVPTRELARAYRDALRGLRGRRALDYGTPQGSERLRIALGDMLSRTRGIPASPSAICVVRGSQHGLYLVARALLKPGDVVGVETPGYPPAWRALQLAGAEIVPLPVDREGLDVDALEDLCASRPIRAVMVTPHHQYPTTVTLSSTRRARLMALAARHRFFVLEDETTSNSTSTARRSCRSPPRTRITWSSTSPRCPRRSRRACGSGTSSPTPR